MIVNMFDNDKTEEVFRSKPSDAKITVKVMTAVLRAKPEIVKTIKEKIFDEVVDKTDQEPDELMTLGLKMLKNTKVV